MSDIMLIGAGRHPATKALRQNIRHRQSFYLGMLHVTPGKQIPVSVSWCAKHYDAICRTIRAGYVLLRYKNDHFVDPEELGTLCFGTAEERDAYEAAAEQGDSAHEGGNDLALTSEDGAELAGTPEVVSVVSEPPVTEPALAAEDAPVVPIPEEMKEETPPEPPPEPVEAPTAENAPTPVEEVAASSEQPAPEAQEERHEPQHEEVEAAEERKPLPENWQSMGKQALLRLCEERSIDVSDFPSNKKLIERLKAWEG